MSAAANPERAALRRGWCPSTLRPMETGDGWLVRLHPPGGVLTPAQIVAIAALAREHGNGLVEISARGNMQLRGISAQTHPALVAALLEQRLVEEHDGDGPQRLTLISPLAGSAFLQDGASAHIDAAAMAEAIETAASTIPGLPAKICVVVDDGGPIALDAFPADLRVVGVTATSVAIGLPGDKWRGPVPLESVAAVVGTILREFALRREQAPEAIRRMRDLSPDALASLVSLPGIAAPAARPAVRRAGRFATGSGRFAAIAALPFGRCDADTLAALGHAAATHHAATLRLSPWRGVAALGLSEAAARGWLADAQRLGLIVDDGDPRLSVQACSGKPACLRAETAAMSDAAQLAHAASLLLAAGVGLHVSGCVKSCAHPGAADLTLVGRGGRYDVVVGGTTRDLAEANHDLSEIIRRLTPGQDLFNRLIQAKRIAGPVA